MICKVCGKEIADDAKFCPHCGAVIETVPHVEEHVSSTEITETSTTVEQAPPRKVWVVFSKISKVLGIVTLCLSVVPYVNLYLIWEIAVVGIVMGCLGKKANTPETLKNASLGLKLSIAALVISLVLGIVFMIILGVVVGAVGALGSMMQ